MGSKVNFLERSLELLHADRTKKTDINDLSLRLSSLQLQTAQVIQSVEGANESVEKVQRHNELMRAKMEAELKEVKRIVEGHVTKSELAKAAANVAEECKQKSAVMQQSISKTESALNISIADELKKLKVELTDNFDNLLTQLRTEQSQQLVNV